jgi:SAM-dependent methyltransferase
VKCGKEIKKQTVDQMVDEIMKLPERSKIQLLAPVVRGRKGEHTKLFEKAKKAGYVRARVDGDMYELSEEIKLDKNKKHSIEVVVDRLAMRELYRILRPGGWGILLVPEDRSREKTYEDNSITDPKERTRLFGQYDHRRVYGRDYDDRLRDAGFTVERYDFARQLTEWEKRLYSPGEDDLIVVRKPLDDGTTT